jgi:hypothetical protein
MVKKRRTTITPWDKWSFNAAWIIALILALGVSFGQVWASYGIWSIILVILGIVTGFVHTAKDVGPLILVAVALAIFTGSSLAIIPAIGPFLSNLVTYFVSYLTPAALIVALRKVYSMFN